MDRRKTIRGLVNPDLVKLARKMKTDYDVRVILEECVSIGMIYQEGK